MGGGGGFISNLFGMGQGAGTPEVPEYTPAPDRTETEAESKSVRDEEQRKLKSRRAMSGTVLTSPLGVDGGSAQAGNRAGVLGVNMGGGNG